MLKLVLISALSVIVLVGYVSSHGMVMNPVCRQSRWRFNSSAPVDWDDDQLYCGSFGVRHAQLLLLFFYLVKLTKFNIADSLECKWWKMRFLWR